VPEYRSGLHISLFVGIAGLYFWPWLSDRLGRRTLLAVNIALFSLLMPVVALSPTFAVFVAARSLVGFALNGEWSLGSMLVAETFAANGRVDEADRAWFDKADSVGIRQVFLPDVLPGTLVALFVACCSTCIFGTVGGWMPLYLSTEKGWSTAEYSAFYVCWGI